MADWFHGHCLICGEQLLRDDDHAKMAHCPTGHYSCEVEKFNQLWNEFNVQVERLELPKASAAYAKKLLKDLKSLNVAERAKAR